MTVGATARIFWKVSGSNEAARLLRGAERSKSRGGHGLNPSFLQCALENAAEGDHVQIHGARVPSRFGQLGDPGIHVNPGNTVQRQGADPFLPPVEMGPLLSLGRQPLGAGNLLVIALRVVGKGRDAPGNLNGMGGGIRFELGQLGFGGSCGRYARECAEAVALPSGKVGRREPCVEHPGALPDTPHALLASVKDLLVGCPRCIPPRRFRVFGRSLRFVAFH